MLFCVRSEGGGVVKPWGLIETNNLSEGLTEVNDELQTM
jgi:hypothetical protein